MKYHTESRLQDSHGLYDNFFFDISVTVSDFPKLLMLCSIGFGSIVIVLNLSESVDQTSQKPNVSQYFEKYEKIP